MTKKSSTPLYQRKLHTLLQVNNTSDDLIDWLFRDARSFRNLQVNCIYFTITNKIITKAQTNYIN
ncbi:hypothetical protein IM792_18060 [Mucilaginibacter sp. JRF]|uniref:hypothetical protein n=1 Tax=Mucilaginibacter sp. JRF TaxID=2780088 RepID=UPI00187F483E|nr:hypothetical protein [Mucilaginibacter sp. JRF]MBE9586363.1 hypothetical protein [Mucilaginibacter sp. JRF]